MWQKCTRLSLQHQSVFSECRAGTVPVFLCSLWLVLTGQDGDFLAGELRSPSVKKITDRMFRLVKQWLKTNNGSDKRKQMTKSRGHTEGSCDFSTSSQLWWWHLLECREIPSHVGPEKWMCYCPLTVAFGVYSINYFWPRCRLHEAKPLLAMLLLVLWCILCVCCQ